MIKRIINNIEDYLYSIGLDEIEVEWDNEMSMTENGILTLGNTADNKVLRDTFEECGLQTESYDIFILALFHELGHFKTLKKISPEVKYKCRRRIVELIYTFDDKGEITGYRDDEDEEALDKEYCHLPTELAATKWGARYIKIHPQEVDALWNTVKRDVMVERSKFI